MGKGDITPGSSTIEGFFGWINERHRIWVRRNDGAPKPWTDDPILQQYKFTNAFRQLDRGTIALQEMLDHDAEPYLIVFNVIWYRLFNLDVHATGLGFVDDLDRVHEYFHSCKGKVFTSAHMTTGVAGEDKVDTYLQAVDMASEYCNWIADNAATMEEMFRNLLHLYMVGKFVAYEIVCDLRFTKVLADAPDKLSWANVGPGAKRGMIRLGLEPSVDSMRDLLVMAPQHLGDHVLNAPVPFELREIEHSLCEFDKYERVRTGVGRPRQKYNGRS